MLGYGAGRLRSWGVGGGWGLADDALRFGGELALAAPMGAAGCLRLSAAPHGRIGSGHQQRNECIGSGCEGI
jgi:hypothetical protein